MSKKFNRESETKIYGENACLTLFKKRPTDIIQLFLTKEKLNRFSALIKYCVQNKKAYHLVTRAELDIMTKATHHEDVCLVIKKESITKTLEQYLQTKPTTSFLIALENVSNPHNVGAILRSAAHFGANGLIIPDAKTATTAAAVRTSEGGNEYVEIYEAANFNKTIALLKKNGFQIITTSSHAKKSLYELKWAQKVVIVFGEEADGLSKETLALGEIIKIPGTDHVESLNVSVAAGVILSDFYQKVKLNEIAPRFK
jgi:TrmH RNA methyltransferase